MRKKYYICAHISVKQCMYSVFNPLKLMVLKTLCTFECVCMYSVFNPESSICIDGTLNIMYNVLHIFAQVLLTQKTEFCGL